MILLISATSYGQRLSLTDLTNLCNKKNWEDVNHSLLAKDWSYYDSEKGSTYKYNTITWSYNKEYYNDKAQGWFYLFTYEGLPNKVSYTVYNKESYSLIQNSISSAGFKLVNSEIENNEVISEYGNASYTLQISTEKRTDEDYSERSITAYHITLIKKAGIYDADNGKKIEYYYDDVVEAEYTLLNGKLTGQLKVYHYNGNLKKSGNYKNGIENGLFKEYDVNGNLEAEYSMTDGKLNGLLQIYFPDGQMKKTGNYLNGKEHGNFSEYNEDGTLALEYKMAYGLKNGIAKVYEDGKLSFSTTYKSDIKSGPFIEYLYNEETGDLQLKFTGDYINEQKSGVWKVILLEDNNERVLKFENYDRGVKHGPFQDVKGDSLIIGTYKNDQLNGDYKIYQDLIKMLIGGTIRTDTSLLTLLAEGHYVEGSKSGYWKNYDLTTALRSEGRFANGLQTGEWKYYYTSLSDGEGGTLPYSKQLFLISNYSNGVLEGKATRLSYLHTEEYPCTEMDETKSILDTCTRTVYEKVLESSFYKNGKLNGAFELRDSLNEIMSRGFFKDDLKEGEWLQRYNEKDINEEVYFIYQKGNYTHDLRDGIWIQYYTDGEITETFNYKNDELHGEWVSWNKFNKPRETKKFNLGKLTELITYDSLGINPVNKYEIYDAKTDSYRCRKTEYLKEGFVSQEYWVGSEPEIDPNWFEMIFLLSIDSNFAEITSGYKDGEFKIVNAKNETSIKGKYFKEDRIGLWTFFYYDQNVKIESNYIQNKQVDEKYFKLNGELYSGEFVYYDSNSELKETRKIQNGLRNGKTTYTDIKTNKTIKKESYKNGVVK
jgi:antitoxin component YwqK of YwqJK toxin-antitoxin module